MRIRWTDRAANDLTEICDYLEIEASKETARSVATSVGSSPQRKARLTG